MTDVLSKEQRKKCMSRVKSKDTKPEVLVRSFLFSHGFRFRLHRKDLPGKPDIVLPKYKTAIFINGCFWHGHSDCRYAKRPLTNAEFWQDKINSNIIRDSENLSKLQRMGWRTYTIWQCELKAKHRETTLRNLSRYIENANNDLP